MNEWLGTKPVTDIRMVDKRVVVTLGESDDPYKKLFYPKMEHDGGGSCCMCGICMLVRWRMDHPEDIKCAP